MVKGKDKRDESGAMKKKKIAEDEARINKLNKENDMSASEKLRRAIEEGKK
jgi:hypothetical protein